MIQKQIDESNESIKAAYDAEVQEYLNLIQGGVPKTEATELMQLEGFSKSLDGIDLKGEGDDALLLL